MSLAARIAERAVVMYQRWFSPMLPAACRFAPTCSEYARLSLIEHGVVRGSCLALWRLVRCHPFNPGGYDPPPVRQRQA